MNCHEAQSELALLAGGDLGDPQREAAIRQHLAECSGCRRKQARMKTALAALAVPPAATYDAVHSLWPSLRGRIAAGDYGSTGWTWEKAGPILAGLTICAGLMVSTIALLRRPLVAEAPPAAPQASEPAVPIYGQYPSAVRPLPQAPPARPEQGTRGVLTRQIVLPEM
jgi:hypothetical protein